MKDYEKAVEVVAQQIRNIDVPALMKQHRIHVGKNDTIDYLLAQGAFKVLAEKYTGDAGSQFLRESLDAEISDKWV